MFVFGFKSSNIRTPLPFEHLKAACFISGIARSLGHDPDSSIKTRAHIRENINTIKDTRTRCLLSPIACEINDGIRAMLVLSGFLVFTLFFSNSYAAMPDVVERVHTMTLSHGTNQWDHAMPTGNGQVVAMVYGN